MDLAPGVLVDHDLSLFTSERCLEDQGVFQLGESVDRLTTHNVGPKSLLKRGLLRPDDVMDTVRLPVLVWLDVKDVLVNTSVLAQSQPVLIREEAHLGLL